MFALKDNLNKLENVITIQNVNKDLLGMENNAKPYHVIQETLITLLVDAAKPLSMLVLPAPIGMDIDVFILLTSAPQVWSGKTSAVNLATHLSVLPTHMNTMANVFHFQQNVPQNYLGIVHHQDVSQPQIPVQLDLIIME